MGVELHTNQAEEPRFAWGFRTQHGLVNDLVNNSDSLGGNSACLRVVSRKEIKGRTMPFSGLNAVLNMCTQKCTQSLIRSKQHGCGNTDTHVMNLHQSGCTNTKTNLV